MTISWKDNCDPVEVASRIEESRRSSKRETVNFGAQFSRHVILLHSMLNFPDAIPEVEARGIARCAAFQAAHGGPITAKTLLAEANKLTDEYTGRPLERYVLVTALTYQPSSPVKGIRMGDTVILFERTLHSRFQAARMKLASEARLSLSIPATTTVPAASVRVHVWARTSNEAADKAIDAVDLVRGIWNWSLNRQRPMRWSTGKRSPVNRLLLGPIHTLHRMSGALATQSWWYEPEWYVDPFGGGVFPEEDIEQMYAFLGKTRRRLARCSYRDAIEQAILRYTRALDMTNWEGAFLKLWSILELLTDSGRLSNDHTVRRAAYIYEDHNYVLQVLRQLQRYRNRSVHSDADNSAIEAFVYQLKGFVEHLLQFHLYTSYEFAKIEDAAAFLALPVEREALERRERLIQYAKKFHSYD